MIRYLAVAGLVILLGAGGYFVWENQDGDTVERNIARGEVTFVADTTQGKVPLSIEFRITGVDTLASLDFGDGEKGGTGSEGRRLVDLLAQKLCTKTNDEIRCSRIYAKAGIYIVALQESGHAFTQTIKINVEGEHPVKVALNGDWKYTNDEYRFEMTVPSGWKMGEGTLRKSLTNADVSCVVSAEQDVKEFESQPKWETRIIDGKNLERLIGSYRVIQYLPPGKYGSSVNLRLRGYSGGSAANFLPQSCVDSFEAMTASIHFSDEPLTTSISVPVMNGVFVRNATTLVFVIRDEIYQPSTTRIVDISKIAYISSRSYGGGQDVLVRNIPVQEWLNTQKREGDLLDESGAPGRIDVTGESNDEGVFIASSIIQYVQ